MTSRPIPFPIFQSIKLCGKGYEGEITIWASRKDDRIVIEITDNGVGVEPSDAPRIFTSGFTTKSQGHGLGLHAFNNYLNANGGSIELTSEGPMKGATVYITIGADHAK